MNVGTKKAGNAKLSGFLHDFFADIFRRHAPPLQSKGQIVLHIEREKLLLRVLKQGSHAPCDIGQRERRRGITAQRDLPFKGAPVILGAQAVGQADQGGFAASARPGTQHKFAGTDGETDIAYGGAALEGIAIGDVIETEHQCMPPMPFPPGGMSESVSWQSVAVPITASAASTKSVSRRVQRVAR